MYMRVIRTAQGSIVAACDKALLGSVLREGKMKIDLQAHAAFYKGERCTKEELKRALMGAASANLMGEKCVGCALEGGFAQKQDCVVVQGVPHVQIYRI